MIDEQGQRAFRGDPPASGAAFLAMMASGGSRGLTHGQAILTIIDNRRPSNAIPSRSRPSTRPDLRQTPSGVVAPRRPCDGRDVVPGEPARKDPEVGESMVTEIGEPLSVDRGVMRRVLAEQIKERLLQAILEGRYPPDSRLVELQISRQLGTSQAPVREALRGLEALGVVEITPFRGARVRRPSTEEILEAYAVRSELESLGARLAVPRLTEVDLDELAGLVAEMQRAAGAGDARAVALADASFHARIIQISGNTALERVWRTLEPFSRTLITLIMPGADPQWTADLHEPVLAALRRRDPELTITALRHHFDDAERMAARLWSEAQAAAPQRSTGGRSGTRAARELARL